MKKQQGGNNWLKIELLAETEKGSWETSTEIAEVYWKWLDGKPVLYIFPPKGWKQIDRDNFTGIGWERENKKGE